MERIKGYDSFLREIRHTIHENPELALEEVKTSAMMEKYLTEWGYTITKGFAKTDVTATLRVGSGSKSIGIRADMDALPIQENTGKPWSSKTPGKMHACGHDGNTTILLGLAKYLAESKKFNGTVNLIFQPAEELVNGAEIMVKAGYLDKIKCDCIFGLHSMPGYEAGHFFFQDGSMMASMDQFLITVKGKGGHGAMPQFAIDPVLIASHIVTALQSIVARNISTQEAAVVTVGSIHAGEVANIIPEEAVMKLSVRALKPDIRAKIHERINEIATGTAKAFGGTADVKHVNGTPPTVNGYEATQMAYNAAKAALPEGTVHYGFVPLMGSEDFAFMLEKNPNGAYLVVGNGMDSAPVHNPHFDLNDDILVPAVTMWASVVEAYLK
ncbi:MAG: amidohydrolase [Deferribacteraceae bacterium]|jgi:hippurate hydrolase|nr:amidohydrolase [Deferribacteraceae bacterium]